MAEIRTQKPFERSSPRTCQALLTFHSLSPQPKSTPREDLKAWSSFDEQSAVAEVLDAVEACSLRRCLHLHMSTCTCMYVCVYVQGVSDVSLRTLLAIFLKLACSDSVICYCHTSVPAWASRSELGSWN